MIARVLIIDIEKHPGIRHGGGVPAIPSSSRIWHRGHPLRLPSGALHSAWTGPGRDAGNSFCYEGMAGYE